MTDLFVSTIDEVLDRLLDQEGLEVDPIDRLEGDTPLHKAVRFTNDQAQENWAHGSSLVELLLDAGADPRSARSSALMDEGFTDEAQRPGYVTRLNSRPWS